MCWQCINEEKIFSDAGLRIIERDDRQSHYPYYPIKLQDPVDGQYYITNPLADWEFATFQRIWGNDDDGEKYLLELESNHNTRKEECKNG